MEEHDSDNMSTPYYNTPLDITTASYSKACRQLSRIWNKPDPAFGILKLAETKGAIYTITTTATLKAPPTRNVNESLITAKTYDGTHLQGHAVTTGRPQEAKNAAVESLLLTCGNRILVRPDKQPTLTLDRLPDLSALRATASHATVSHASRTAPPIARPDARPRTIVTTRSIPSSTSRHPHLVC